MACPRDFHYHFCVADWRALRPGSYPSSIEQKKSQDDSSDVSDLEKFDEACTDFSALTKGVDPQTLERDGSGNPNDEVQYLVLTYLAGWKHSTPLPTCLNRPFHLVQPVSTWRDYWKGAAMKSLCGTPIQTCNCTMSGSLQRTWWSCLLSIWLWQFLRCFGMYWTILARSSMILRLFFFLLYAAWVRSRAERPSVSYTKVVMGVAWTGHNLQFTKTN